MIELDDEIRRKSTTEIFIENLKQFSLSSQTIVIDW